MTDDNIDYLDLSFTYVSRYLKNTFCVQSYHVTILLIWKFIFWWHHLDAVNIIM